MSITVGQLMMMGFKSKRDKNEKNEREREKNGERVMQKMEKSIRENRLMEIWKIC